jgi:hypothetical protein
MSPVQITGFRAFQAQLLAEMERVDARIAEIVGAGAKPVAFVGQHQDVYMVHLDTYPERLGLWRITRLIELNGRLEPAGHVASTTFDTAIREAWENGADLFSVYQEAS